MSTDNNDAGSKELEYVKKAVSEKFKFLEGDGYLFHSETKQSEFFIDELETTYVNEAKKRKVSVSYTKSNSEGIRYTFTLSVTRTPYKGVNDFFSHSEFCRLTGADFNGTIEHSFDEGRAEYIIEKLKEFIQKNAAIFIEGIDWVEGYYPKW
jgi:hypothetical protein